MKIEKLFMFVAVGVFKQQQTLLVTLTSNCSTNYNPTALSHGTFINNFEP
ncbi:hypothetical protein HanXRQr2_Chr07g0311371 [Helianthus annuus]|uniref:Uncharacterized protein n=1 Tax=Helianthus annuus TaxID=4232 RepID=A0A9K3NH42_HELAN|nr:hypothetical protein HanXRQr2_Chr07g0311371 [Helianthus annuus]KAJ0558436.1 hypothetical protein HanIR_Chr07g0336351 [Helianthus annuus]KAJ0564368.1 hypothetical protein HanHA89_Chr07g0273561 [Helianthus annuus]KAJ0818888.1 hypothetical protein HanLR1_Chr00c0305g0737161 [Helianthus annuus]KAJ0906065.1 hypothetical protein HanPSC8_Chr07g0301261 [Helianthus annuus]